MYCTGNELINTKYFPTDCNILDYFNNHKLPSSILYLNPIVKRKSLFKHQEEYGIWNADGSFNKNRFDIFSNDYDNGLIK